MFVNKSYGQLDDEEEGFIKDKEQILIDHKQRFSTISNHIKRSPFKKVTSNQCSNIDIIENLKFSPFINQSLREACFKEYIRNKEQNVIFNAYSNQIGYSDPNVAFDSNFAMGNLQLVIKVKNYEYELYMRPDTNTVTHFQWFYFRVYVKKKRKLAFTLKNFVKSTMLYSKGLRPFFKSNEKSRGSSSARKSIEFDNINFEQIPDEVEFSEDTETGFYNLKFTYDFKEDKQEVYFCSQPPYGLQSVTTLLKQIANSQIKQFTLGKTVLGNKIPYLVFPQKIEQKAIAIVIARQHPGEVVGSWMMDGFVRQLSEGQLSNYIRWVVIPMINIDGVQLGNNRTGVLGHDFNRNWTSEESVKARRMFPQICAVVNYVKKLKKKYPNQVKMFLDLHGHSSQPNVFTYGPPHEEKNDNYFICRLFPEMLAHKNENFKVEQSSYMLNGDKKNAARCIFLNDLKCTFGVMNGLRVGSEETVQVGRDIAISANKFLESLYAKENAEMAHSFLESIKEKYLQVSSEAEQYDSASESSENTPNQEQFEQNIQGLLEGKGKKCNIESSKAIKTENSSPVKQAKQKMRKNSDQVINSSKFTIRRTGSDPHKQVPKNYRYSTHKRFSTEQSLKFSKEEKTDEREIAYFPPINQRLSQIGILDKFPIKQKEEKEEPITMNMKEIQQRLFRLRHSKMGRKILVINAFGV